MGLQFFTIQASWEEWN